MASLESTPQRVFYLINNFNNVQDNRSLWDMKVTRSEDGRTLITEYTEIVATKDPDDMEFETVAVRVAKVKEVTVSNPDLGIIDRSFSRNELDPMEWNDIDGEIVGIVNNYYDSDESHRDLRERMVNYADAISEFVEENRDSDIKVDRNGLSEITIYGLPVDTIDSDECYGYDITIKSEPSLDDYEIEIRNEDSITSLTLKELNELIEKSHELDDILEYMGRYL